MEITINVTNQTMEIDDGCRYCDENYRTENIIEGSQQFVKFRFNFSNDWYSLKTFAQFQQAGQAYNVYLDENGCAYLPSEIKAGVCNVMLYGAGDKTIATSNFLTFVIGKNLLITDGTSTEISEPLYNQLIDEINKFKTDVSGSAELANQYAQEAHDAAQKALEAAQKANDAAENAGGGIAKLNPATDTELGGVKAPSKTNAQTIPVGIDQDGFLWVSPLDSEEYDSIVIFGGDATTK